MLLLIASLYICSSLSSITLLLVLFHLRSSCSLVSSFLLKLLRRCCWILTILLLFSFLFSFGDMIWPQRCSKTLLLELSKLSLCWGSTSCDSICHLIYLYCFSQEVGHHLKHNLLSQTSLHCHWQQLTSLSATQVSPPCFSWAFLLLPPQHLPNLLPSLCINSALC